MEYKNILFQEEGNGVVIVTFNRPKALNAMNDETLQELVDAVNTCRQNDAIKVMVITGAGDKAFAAGADIVHMQTMRPQEALVFAEAGQEAMRLIETMGKPSIAAVNGYAFGGGMEISMACDIRFAAETARFGQPEVQLGIIPGWGGTQRLSRLVGTGMAKELIMSGEQISAQRAYDIRLVSRLYPVDRLMEETPRLCSEGCRHAGLRPENG